MSTIDGSFPASVKNSLVPLFEACTALWERTSRDINEAALQQAAIAERASQVLADYERLLGEVGKTLKDLMVLEGLPSAIAALKEEVASLSRECELVRRRVELEERRATTRMLKNGIAVSVILGRVVVEGGTCEKLFENLFVNMEGGDVPEYQATFLATYRSFTNSRQLLRMVMQRYDECLRAPPDPARPDQARRLRLRIINFLRTWAQSYWDDEDAQVLKMYREFVMGVVATQETSALAEMLLRAVASPAGGVGNARGIPAEPPPVPLAPRVLPFTLLDVEPLELARQVTLLDHELFRQLRSHEFLKTAWNGKDAERRAPNIRRLIQHTNRMADWVAQCIISEPARSRRAQLIEHFIRTARCCLRLNNFAGLAWILMALDSDGVFRLRRTWERVASRRRQRLQELKALMSHERAFKAYRQALASVSPPLVPYLVVYLRDLTLIEEANPDFIEGGLINFAKRGKLAEIIEEIRMYQQKQYNLQRLEEVVGYILEAQPLDDKQLLQLSYQIEPDR
jgi:son of sevenless-like protein